MSSTELLEAASISITSSEVAEAIARQESHSPHGDAVGPPPPRGEAGDERSEAVPPASPWQFSEAARIFAIEVLPVPREPTNR